MTVRTMWGALQPRLVSHRRPTDDGASLVEYALLVALIAIVCIVAVAFLGDTTSTRYSNFGSQVGAAGQ